jgi:membrane-bound lytic murein transglycosylase F
MISPCRNILCRTAALLAAGLLVLGLVACGTGRDSLSEIKQSGDMIVLIINSPTAYYYDRDDRLAGPEYEMTQSFARYLGVGVEYKAYDSTQQVIEALRNGEGHIAAAGLTINDSRKRTFDFGPSYQTLQEKLICHRDHADIKSVDDLKDVKIVVAAESSYADTLAQLDGVTWESDPDHNTQYLINEVAQKNLECTVSDSTLFFVERRYHTEIEDKFDLSSASQLAWMLNKNDDDLMGEIHDWFDEYRENDLQTMQEKYYGYAEIFDYVDTHVFIRRIDKRLKQYLDDFIEAGKKYDIDPYLLAAQSYQESHWDRKAKSPTGVRGMMMLTQPVAKSLGVSSRLNARENIFAGAKFHNKMKKMVEHVEEPDRSWLALAAYNVGRGHFRDAQALAKKLGKNPDKWNDMKTVLPLLADKDYYKDLRYGYARGNEPVTYVTRIRNYEKLLHDHLNTGDQN